MIKNKIMTELGGVVGFQEAQARGDVWSETDDNGFEEWFVKGSVKKESSGWKDSTKVHAGTKKLARGEADALRAVDHLYNVKFMCKLTDDF